MTAFIMQEANEKAQEIKIKANEEFAIEKSKLVRQETDSIDAAYEKKFKQATMSQQITRSTVANKTRLKVLGARQELLDDIFEQAQQRLADGAKDKSKYKGVLTALALEGFYALHEPAVQVRARKADYGIVKEAIAAAAKEYQEELDKEIKATIDESNPLPDGRYVPLPGAPRRETRLTRCSSGGLSIIGGGGKIEIDNTFEARLNILKYNALPAVRETLFGKNPNRKFFD